MTCRSADPGGGAFPPAGWTRWSAAEWIRDVWTCSECGSLWHLSFDKHEMCYREVVPLTDEMAPLLRHDTPWHEAWACRAHSHFLIPRYLALFLEFAPLPWSKAAGGMVDDILADDVPGGEAAEEAALAYLYAIFANYRSALAARTKADEAGSLFRRCEELRSRLSDSATIAAAWRRFAERAETTCAGLARRAAASAEAVQAARIAANAPPVVPPFSPFYEERIPGPEPDVASAIDRPGAVELARAGLGRLAENPWRALGTAVVVGVAMELLVPQIPGGDTVARVAVGAMALLLYAATASVISGRWSVSQWRLALDRFSEVLRTWSALLVVLPVWAALLALVVVLLPDETATPRAERLLWYGAFLVTGVRLWPLVSMPFVYRGYLLRWSPSIGPRVMWIGPGMRTAWRISGQPGFCLRVTAPLLSAIVLVLAWLEATEWAWWTRIAVYALAIPALVQYADEAVDRWRIRTGNAAFDR